MLRKNISLRSRNGMSIKDVCLNIINRNAVFNKYEKKYQKGIRAGSSVYANLWSRDFLYSAPFLMKYDKLRPYVAEHVFLIISFIRKDFLMPKEIDTMNPDWRVVRGTFRNFLNLKTEELPIKTNWKAFYTDTLGSDAVDTNLLTINAVLELFNYEEYKDHVLKYKEKILDGMKYYKKFIKDGLIYQMKYSDFQDSIERKGATFLTNLLFWKVTKKIEEIYSVENYSNILKEKITKTFWIPELGLYRGIKNKNYMNIDANLLAIDWEFNTSETFWNSIKNYSKWWKKGYPGPPTVPQHPNHEKAICVRFVGIPGYHDEYFWSWVMGLAAKVAYKMKDFKKGDDILRLLTKAVERDQTVYDSYKITETGDIVQVVTYGFRAEYDWTWGASYILNAIVTKEQLQKNDI